MGKLLVILGPTATGKTDLGIYLANRLKVEIVSCDSRQVYTGLDIGTGKLPGSGRWEMRRGKGCWIISGVKIWMYDVVEPKVQYTVADYVKDAEKVIGEINKRGKLPIIVGGTGFYIKALLEGLPNLAVPLDQKLRKKLNKLSLEKLQQRLQKLSFEIWQKMNYSDKQNPRRLVRAIELAMSNQEEDPSSDLRRTQDDKLRLEILRNLSNVLKIGLTAPREILYQRVDQRIVTRIKEGMIEEAKNLHQRGLTFKRMRQLGLEYGVLADYLEGKIKKGELIKIMQGKIHGYLRRQLTWFKKERGVNWFDITSNEYLKKIEQLVGKWYHIENYD